MESILAAIPSNNPPSSSAQRWCFHANANRWNPDVRNYGTPKMDDSDSASLPHWCICCPQQDVKWQSSAYGSGTFHAHPPQADLQPKGLLEVCLEFHWWRFAPTCTIGNEIHTPKRWSFKNVHQCCSWEAVSSHWDLDRAVCLSFKTFCSSCKQYWPSFRVCLKKRLCIIFVNASANWAPECAHLRFIPSASMSLMALACSCVRNSWQFGGAVLVTRWYNDLQSVTAMSGSSLLVAVAYVCGSCLRVSVVFFQLIIGLLIHAQYNLNHDNWSKVLPKEVVSAERVLVTTRWIFLQPHDIGFTAQTWFLEISAWVVMMIIPVCDSGCFFEANEASEKARNRTLSMGIGWIRMWVSLYLLASCNTWLACIKVAMVALFMSLWRNDKRLARSGLVFTDANCNEPMSPRNWCFSCSVTSNSSLAFLCGSIWIGSILDTYFSWDMVML